MVLVLLACGCSTNDQPAEPVVPTRVVASPTDASSTEEALIASRAHTWGEKLQVFKMRCMRDAGWDEHLQADFSLTGTVPPEQRAAYQADAEACESAYEAKFPKPVLTAADYRARYADELKTMKCLEEQGYPPVATPISEQRFVSEMLQGSVSWTAYDAVGDVSGEEWDRLQKVCPQPGDM